MCLDFSCSLEHVQNAGRVVINDASPPPGFFHFPIGYQGRASSIVVSGTDIERPLGQYRSPSGDGAVVTAPSGQVDYELEFAAVVGRPLSRGKRLNATEADEHIFGFVLLNDWSGAYTTVEKRRVTGDSNLGLVQLATSRPSR